MVPAATDTTFEAFRLAVEEFVLSQTTCGGRPDADGVPLDVLLCVSDCVDVGERDGVGLWDAVNDDEAVPDDETDAVLDRVWVCELLPLCEGDTVEVVEGVWVVLGLMVDVPEGVTLGDAEIVNDCEGVWDGVCEVDGVTDAVPVLDWDAVPDVVRLGVTVWLAVTLEVLVDDWLRVAVCVFDWDGVGERDWLGENELDRVPDGEDDCVRVWDKVGAWVIDGEGEQPFFWPVRYEPA
jgi:hypothetical protein